MAGGGRLLHGQPHQHRQDSGSGQEAQEAHLHRSERQRCVGESLLEMSQACGPRDNLSSGQPAAGEGGGESLVLQSRQKEKRMTPPGVPQTPEDVYSQVGNVSADTPPPSMDCKRMFSET